ncbi:MAG TPA: YCF48-related protein [Pyrinomonadaceae bacterium]|nr:YCF48-related protein [Pyrinomonadaceae bacterium]
MNGDQVVRRRRQTVRRAASVLALCLFGVALAFVHAGAQEQRQQGEGWAATRHGAAGSDLNTIYFTDNKRGWMAGDGGLAYRTEDAGRTWVRQAIGTDEQINDLYFHDKEDGYLVAGSAIHVTVDGGRTWREARRFSPADFGGGTPELYSVRFASKKKGWIVGSISRRDVVTDSLVLYTDDAGATWRTQPVPSRDELINLDFANDKRGWIVGDKGTILATIDGGLNWTRQRAGTSATLYHVHFADNERGWAVGERATILRTTNGGETWAASTASGLPPRTTFLSVQFAGKEQGWIVGRGGVILRTDDGGRTWLQQESGTKQHLYALFVGKKQNWAVGGDGMVLQYER